MKTTLLLFCCLLLCICILHAQVLFGTTYQGGTTGNGTVIKFNTAADTLTALYSFDGTNGADPVGSLVQATNGKLYGMTYQGGSSDAGTLFSYNVATNTFTKLFDFDYSNGAYPTGNLVQASDGKLYGMTTSGGSSSFGIIFSFDPATNSFTRLLDFDRTNGEYPTGSLVEASDGKLYGMTEYGGSNNYGVIFSFDPTTNTLAKQFDFDGTNGENPYGSLVQASDGKLYGMTLLGGSDSHGTIFSFNPSTSIFTKQFDFDGTNGEYPYGNLVQAANGRLYGLTYSGGRGGYGVIFSFDPSTNTYNQLFDFDYDNGAFPLGSLALASNGKLYGLTYSGGDNGYGVAFSVDPATAAFTRLADFNGTNGSYPYYASFIEPTPHLTISDVSVAEGNSGSKTVKFKVTLSLPSTKKVTVTYKTADGSATQPSDYTAKTGMLSFTPGLRIRYATVKIKGDRLVEGDESFGVMLSQATNAILYDSVATGTIVNDDIVTLAKATAKQSHSGTIGIAAMNVFPNPAIRTANVQLSGFSGKVNIQLADLNGQVLKQLTLQSNSAKLLQHALPVANLANGTYLLVAVDEKGNKQTAKVVVVH